MELLISWRNWSHFQDMLLPCGTWGWHHAATPISWVKRAMQQEGVHSLLMNIDKNISFCVSHFAHSAHLSRMWLWFLHHLHNITENNFKRYERKISLKGIVGGGEENRKESYFFIYWFTLKILATTNEAIRWQAKRWQERGAFSSVLSGWHGPNNTGHLLLLSRVLSQGVGFEMQQPVSIWDAGITDDSITCYGIIRAP